MDRDNHRLNYLFPQRNLIISIRYNKASPLSNRHKSSCNNTYPYLFYLRKRLSYSLLILEKQKHRLFCQSRGSDSLPGNGSGRTDPAPAVADGGVSDHRGRENQQNPAGANRHLPLGSSAGSSPGGAQSGTGTGRDFPGPAGGGGGRR